jgi:hypothetical protein
LRIGLEHDLDRTDREDGEGLVAVAGSDDLVPERVDDAAAVLLVVGSPAWRMTPR